MMGGPAIKSSDHGPKVLTNSKTNKAVRQIGLWPVSQDILGIRYSRLGLSVDKQQRTKQP